jgi:LPS export ABC transporter permease LptG
LRILDRYLLQSFLLPFAYCLIGFLAVWLIFDLSSEAPDFIENRVAPAAIGAYYLSQLPAIAVITLPVGLLLALLYCLGRMSQANEILAMLSAGVSLGRILTPFFAVGLAVTGVSTYLNHALAPQAEAKKQELLAEMEEGNGKLEKRAFVLQHLFRNRTDNRLWYIERMPTHLGRPLEGVQVVQQDRADNITDKFYAHKATYDFTHKAWIFQGAKIVHFTSAGDVASEAYPEKVTFTGWSETPWRIASSILEADKLSVPELHQYLTLNSDFTAAQLAPFRTYLDYRWALPWSCLVVVCVSAPLGVVYNRRSVVTGVASAIFCFFLILFLGNLFIALGRGDRIEPVWAAWVPNIIFAVVGLILLRQRSLNRDRLPTTPALMWDFLTAGSERWLFRRARSAPARALRA